MKNVIKGLKNFWEYLMSNRNALDEEMIANILNNEAI